MKQPADVLIQGARKLKASKTRAKVRAETEEWVARVRASWQAYQEEQARRAELLKPLTEAQNRQADALLEQFGFENAKRSETQNWLDQELEHHRRHGVGGLRATRPGSACPSAPKGRRSILNLVQSQDQAGHVMSAQGHRQGWPLPASWWQVHWSQNSGRFGSHRGGPTQTLAMLEGSQSPDHPRNIPPP